MTTSVLIVDSNIPFMIGLKQALEEAGDYRVAMAANPHAAEEALRAAIPDIAVADFEMSGMDVMEMLRMLRNTQPDLPIILTPHDELQLERAQFMDVQAVLLKPYSARELLPRLREVLHRPEPYAYDQAALDDAADEHPPAESFDLADEARDAAGTADDFDLDWLEMPRETPEESPERGHDDQHATRVLSDDELPDASRVFVDTDASDAELWLEWDDLDEPEAAQQALDEPARHPDDTPYIPSEYAAAPDVFEGEPLESSEAFEDVLDVVSAGDTGTLSDDREFHDLVDSMRRDDAERPRRSRLVDLLASLEGDAAADASPEAGDALDRVLDAIRKGHAPVPEDVQELADSDLGDDTTIGDVIDGLFDPGFEGVLAALSGAEIDDSAIEEPTYEDDYEDDMTGAEGEAVAAQEPAEPPPGESRDAGPVIAELPPGEDDSRKYPATTALAAVSSDDSDFSLDDLLNQIEQQLPQVRTDRPRLKPLPSWGYEGYLEGTSDLVTMFDRVEGTRDEAPAQDAIPVELGDSEPLMFHQDRRWREPSRRVKPEFTRGPEQSTPGAEQGDEDEAGADAPSEADVDEIIAGREEHAQPGTGREADKDLSDEAIAAAFYAGIREQGAYFDDVPALPPDLPEPPFDLALDDEHLVPVSVDEATQRIEAVLDEDEDAGDQDEADDAADAAQIAVQLTQYSLESSAQVTLLSRGGELLAHAGDVDEDTVDGLFEAVDRAWTRSAINSESLIRVVELPDGGEFLVYSTRLAGDMTLSMAFHANTSLRLIRRQARRLSESLDLVPDTSGDADDPPPAARTLPSRPTDAAPPPGLREAASGQALGDLPPRPGRDDEPYTTYTALWLPYDPGQELTGAFAGALEDWIRDVAEESAWELIAVQVHADYVILTLSAPQKLSPDSVITHLMDRTAARAADEYPDVTNGRPLWTDGYYVVTPPRELSDREIARIVTVQRNAQMER